jgi:hypothetical protein
MSQIRINAEVLSVLHSLTRVTLVLYDHAYPTMTEDQNKTLQSHLSEVVKHLESATTELKGDVDGLK